MGLTAQSPFKDFHDLSRWLCLSVSASEFGYHGQVDAFEAFDLIDQIRLQPQQFAAEWQAFVHYLEKL
jgi:hypothetical protein